MIDTVSYDAYGNITSETNASVGGRLKYAGYEWDSWTGMERSGARFYFPAMQVWVTQDPSGLQAGPNPYEYAEQCADGCDGSERKRTDREFRRRRALGAGV